jgi:hypothetical protein
MLYSIGVDDSARQFFIGIRIRILPEALPANREAKEEGAASVILFRKPSSLRYKNLD